METSSLEVVVVVGVAVVVVVVVVGVGCPARRPRCLHPEDVMTEEADQMGPIQSGKVKERKRVKKVRSKARSFPQVEEVFGGVR